MSSIVANSHPNPGTNKILNGGIGRDPAPAAAEPAAFGTRRSTNSISFMPASFCERFVNRCKIADITRAEKVLSVSLAVTCIIVLILVVLVLSMFFNPKIIHGLLSDNRCLSPVCVSSAAEIIRRIDESVDPCEDFYKFSCGGLDNNLNPIPDDKSSLSTASILQLEIDKRLRVLISNINTTNDPEESNYLTKMKVAYDKCMNASEHEELGDQPLAGVLADIGGWPVVIGSQWNESNFSLAEVLAKLKDIGYDHDFFAKIEVAPHVLAHKYNLIYIGTSDLGLDDRSYYLDKTYASTMDAYKKFMLSAAKELGSPLDMAEIVKQMDDVLAFEKKIAELQGPRDPQANILNYMNLSMIQELAPFMNWTHYLNGAFQPYIFIPDNAYMIIKNPPFVANISRLIESTSPRTIANYVGWRVILESTSILSEKWALMGRKVWKQLDGRHKLRNRWTYCVSVVKKYFDFGTSSLYVQNLRGEEDQQTRLVRQIVSAIKSSFVDSLRTNAWMDDKTREEAINKTSKMKLHVGYPVELLNDTAIDEFYSIVQLSRNFSFFQNSLLLRRFKLDKKYMKVQFDNQKGHWHEYGKVADVNAYYRAQENSIEFPLSIIEAMRIHQSKPMYLNFGDIGWVVGHEINHGFDNMGKHFDGDGEYRSWWTNETDAEYEKRTECFAKQYHTYDLPDSDQSIDGNLTLGENIADNGGLKEAFRAYKNFVRDSEEAELPGLKYNAAQLFFIQSAAFYCGKYRTEITEYGLKTDGHSPNMYRVIGTMSNSQEFSETFSCPPGSRMNPVQKCTLW